MYNHMKTESLLLRSKYNTKYSRNVLENCFCNLCTVSSSSLIDFVFHSQQTGHEILMQPFASDKTISRHNKWNRI